MDRREIYHRYLGFLKSEYKVVTLEHCAHRIGNVKYALFYSEIDRVYFYCASISKFAKYTKSYADSIGDVYELKLDIRKEIAYKNISHVPVIEVCIDSHKFMGKKVDINLRDSDLSNIVNFQLLGSDNIANVTYPKGYRKLKPACVSRNILKFRNYMDVIKSIDFSEVKSMSKFMNGTDITEFDFDKIDTNSVTALNSFFKNCKRLKRVVGTIKSVSDIDISNMFEGCESLEYIAPGIFSKIQICDASQAFSGCRGLNNIPDIKFNLQYLLNTADDVAERMFAECKCTDCENMFRIAYRLCESTVVIEAHSGYVDKNVPNHAYMFEECKGIFRLPKMRVKASKAVSLFAGARFEVFDMSNAIFIPEGNCKLWGMFRGLYDDYFPDVMVVSASTDLDDYESIGYSVIDLPGAENTEIYDKIKLNKMMNDGRKLIIRV